MKESALSNFFYSLKRRNIKLFGFFLVAASLFLILTKFSEYYTQVIPLEVELINLDDEVVILNDSLNSAQITVKGKGFSLLKYMFDGIVPIELDAKTEVFSKEKKLFWDISNKKYKLTKEFGKDIEILSIRPDTLTFNFDVLSSKKVPVILNTSISYALGYDIVDKLRLSQDSVKIIGTKKVLDSINNIKTELFTLKNVSKNVSKSISFKEEISQIEIIPNKIEINGIVKRFTEGKVTIPIRLINAPLNKKVNYFPKTIDVLYYVDLDNFKKIRPKDFIVTCDFKNLEYEDSASLDVELTKVSPLVKRASIMQDRIEFIISD